MNVALSPLFSPPIFFSFSLFFLFVIFRLAASMRLWFFSFFRHLLFSSEFWNFSDPSSLSPPSTLSGLLIDPFVTPTPRCFYPEYCSLFYLYSTRFQLNFPFIITNCLFFLNFIYNRQLFPCAKFQPSTRLSHESWIMIVDEINLPLRKPVIYRNKFKWRVINWNGHRHFLGNLRKSVIWWEW